MAYMKDSTGRRLDSFPAPLGEIAYAELTSVQTATAVGAFSGANPAGVVLNGLTVVFTLDRPTRVAVDLWWRGRSDAIGGGVGLIVMDGGTTEVVRAFVKTGTAAMDFEASAKRELTLAAGTYTYTGRWGMYGGGTISIGSGPTYPVYLSVRAI